MNFILLASSCLKYSNLDRWRISVICKEPLNRAEYWMPSSVTGKKLLAGYGQYIWIVKPKDFVLKKEKTKQKKDKVSQNKNKKEKLTPCREYLK